MKNIKQNIIAESRKQSQFPNFPPPGLWENREKSHSWEMGNGKWFAILLLI